MSKIIVLVVIVSALADCCLGSMAFDWESNEDFQKIKAKFCDEKVRPDATQMAEITKCSRPCNESAEDPLFKKYIEKMRANMDDCSKVADDVNNLKLADEEQNKMIYMICSKKFRECLGDKRQKCIEEMKTEGDKKDGTPGFDMEKMKKKFQERLDCSKKALGIA